MSSRPWGQAQVGDAQLLRDLHDEHGQALWRYALSLTEGDSARAEDVVQETLLRAWRHPQVFEPERGSPRAWLYTVARHLVIDDHRSLRNRTEIVAGDVPDQPVEDEAQRIVDHELIVTALRQLSADHRAVIRECYLRGSSVREAAAALGIPVGTVKSRTHYALHALRLAIDELGGTR